jgi:uncharacterized protein (DUF924 family)
MTRAQQDEVLDFWFGELDEHGCASAEQAKLWWRKSPEFDAEIRDRFGALHAAIMAGERDDWLATARGRLAYIIVLDQFSRNMYRDKPQMYAGDDRACAAVLEGLDRGHDRELAADERCFFLMPLMHSEEVDHQRDCVARFEALAAEHEGTPASRPAGNLKYARQHADIVERFGRFPHRNRILGRESTAEEKAFLDRPGSSF